MLHSATCQKSGGVWYLSLLTSLNARKRIKKEKMEGREEEPPCTPPPKNDRFEHGKKDQLDMDVMPWRDQGSCRLRQTIEESG